MATPNIVPRADSEGGIGTASKYWASAYIDTIYVGGGKVGRDADNNLDFSTDNNIFFKINGSNEIVMDANRIYPAVNGGSILGHPSYQWADLFLHDGAVINFNNGNVTLTHSNNALTLADSDAIQVGTGGDLAMVHDSSNSHLKNWNGHLYITQNSDDKDIILQSDDGSGGVATYLTLDGGEGHMIASKELNFADSVAATFGDKAGGDLEIKEQSGNSYISNFTGNLEITQNADDSAIIFKCDDGSGGTTEYFKIDGNTQYMLASKNIRFLDNKSVKLGTGGDAQILHNGSDTFIENFTGDLKIIQKENDKDIIFQSDNGAGSTATYFFLDGSSAAHDGSATTALYTNWPDLSRISLGTSHDFQMYHTGTQTVISQQGTGNLVIQNTVNDADISFSSDDGSGGVTEYFRVDGSSALTYFSKHIQLADGQNAYFGGGADLSIKHDGSNSYISQGGTGDLYIENTTDDKDVIFRCDDGAGSVETYFFLDGSSGGGAPFTVFPDNANLVFGDGHDLRIFHNSANSYIENKVGNLEIKNDADNGSIIFKNDDASGGTTTYFYLDGALSTPYTRFPDSSILAFGTDADLAINHNGTNSLIENYNGNLEIVNNADDGDIIFKSDDGSGGTTAYLTLDGGSSKIIVGKQLEIQGDNRKLTLGASSDLEIYHDGTDSRIYNATGDFIFRNSQDDGDVKFQCDDGSGGIAEYFRLDGANTEIRVSQKLQLSDNVKLALGNGEDLEIYHDGSTSAFIYNKIGDLYIKNDEADHDIYFQCDDGSGGLTNYLILDGGEVSVDVMTQKVKMPNLPTSDPNNSGQLWNDNGTLKISAGG